MRQGSKDKIMHGLSAVQAARSVLTDEQAAEVPDLYKAWEPGKAYEAGERVTYDGTLYKVSQAHTSQETWAPDAAVSLFTEILPGQGGTAVGEWEQPIGNKGLYNTGDRCRYKGVIYESVIDNNSWSPEAYPAGWKAIE